MATCKHCGTQFHYCSSCGDDGHSEYGYCTETCMYYATNNNKDLRDLKTLPPYYRNMLVRLSNEPENWNALERWLRTIQEDRSEDLYE